jgi:hypothetical protein
MLLEAGVRTLRSAVTVNRTDVQASREMKQPTTRPFIPTPPAPARWPAHAPKQEMKRELAIGVRLFKD